jgi:3-methylcrotonyl-CoA carboxylase alpha subunit
MIETLLIANRGEIALRILRTCREMGIRAVAVYSDADADLPIVHQADWAVRLGAAPASESYLDMEKLLAAALGNGVDAIHPGYGFLSENAAFAELCRERGVVFIGPPPEAIRAMGDKAQAKRRMTEAGVPVLPGYLGAAQDAQTLRDEAARVGYPLLLKAVAGGGGRGIRLVERDADLPAALESARREAQGAFKDGRVMIEKYLAAPHHVEFQVLADTHGTVLHLFERECSVQRRHQKIVEETPSPLLTPELRARMAQAAVTAARSIGYVGAGTVEFLVEEGGGFYFLEMNTRLQVEHPITEMTLGVDLVRMQIEVAEGRPLAVRQEHLRPRGHAIECRLNAEDPGRNFLPSVGPLRALEFPAGAGLRVDTGFAPGSEVSPHYDSLLAKLVAWGTDRGEALRRMRALLAGSQVTGIATNLPLLQAILAHPEFAEGRYSTAFIAAHLDALLAPPDDPALLQEQLLAAAAVEVALSLERRRADSRPAGPSPWERTGGWGGATHPTLGRTFTLAGTAHTVEIRVLAAGPGELRLEVAREAVAGQAPGGPGAAGVAQTLVQACRYLPRTPRSGLLELGMARLPLRWDAEGERRWLTLRGVHCLVRAQPPSRNEAPAAGELAERLKAPLPGKVVKVAVEKGQRVAAGDLLVILEAMKMEHKISAPYPGTVRHLRFREGDLANRDDLLVELEPLEA